MHIFSRFLAFFRESRATNLDGLNSYVCNFILGYRLRVFGQFSVQGSPRKPFEIPCSIPASELNLYIYIYTLIGILEAAILFTWGLEVRAWGFERLAEVVCRGLSLGLVLDSTVRSLSGDPKRGRNLGNHPKNPNPKPKTAKPATQELSGKGLNMVSIGVPSTGPLKGNVII